MAEVKKEQSPSVFNSVRWSVVGQVGSRILKLGISVVLARLLAPADFGLMAMAMVIIGFMETFYELGTGSAIIQKKELSQELLSSLFYINITFGAMLGLLFALTGPYVALLYQDDRVAPILEMLGLVFLLSSFGLVHYALLRRNLQFDRLTIVEFLVLIIDGAVAVVLAYMGWNVWALVYSLLASRLAMTVFLFVAISWRPSLVFSVSEVKTVLNFTLNLTGSKVFNYFSRNSDKFIIGRFLGASSLGYYSLAFKLVTYPIEFVQGALGRVLFPALARLDNDKSLRELYLRACGAISLVVFPIMIGMGTLAFPLIEVIYGDKWMPSAILLVILTPVGMLQSVLSTVIHLYLVKDRADKFLVWAFTSGALIAVGFVCGLPWGLTGVTAAFSIVVIVLTLLGFWMPFRLIGLRMGVFVRALAPYMLMSLAMGAIILGCTYLLKAAGSGSDAILAVGFFAGLFSYLIMTLRVNPPAFADLLRLFPGSIVRRLHLNNYIQSPQAAAESDSSAVTAEKMITKTLESNEC